MKDKSLSNFVTAVRSRPPLRRSALYQWLHSRRRTIAKMLAQVNPSWIVIAESVAAAGVANTKGQPPSPASVRRVWACVLKDVAVAEEARRKRGVQPSRLPVTWRPPVVQQPRPIEQPRYPPALDAQAPSEELNDVARETLASLKRQFEHSDRFLHLPKKKD